MLMRPAIRKFALTVHVASSLGWFGAVAAFLVLSLTDLHATDPAVVHGSYIAMDVVTRAAIWPFCILALLTGIIQGLGTQWGLFQHYWVIAKLAITLVSTLLLGLHTRPIAYLASVAAAQPTGADMRRLRLQLIIDAAAALGALPLATVLSIYKPWGRRDSGRRTDDRALLRPGARWMRVVLLLTLLLFLGIIARHLAGSGFPGH